MNRAREELLKESGKHQFEGIQEKKEFFSNLYIKELKIYYKN